jgi:hypothetical protein
VSFVNHPWTLAANSAHGTETCSPVARFFTAKPSASTSFPPNRRRFAALPPAVPKKKTNDPPTMLSQHCCPKELVVSVFFAD